MWTSYPLYPSIAPFKPWVVVAARKALAANLDRFLPSRLLVAFLAECHNNLPLPHGEQRIMDFDHISIVRQYIWKAFDIVTRFEAFLPGASVHKPNAPLSDKLGIAHLTRLRDELQLLVHKWEASSLATNDRLSANATEQPADELSERIVRATDVDGPQDPLGELARAYAAKARAELKQTLSSLNGTVGITDIIIAGPIDE